LKNVIPSEARDLLCIGERSRFLVASLLGMTVPRPEEVRARPTTLGRAPRLAASPPVRYNINVARSVVSVQTQLRTRPLGTEKQKARQRRAFLLSIPDVLLRRVYDGRCGHRANQNHSPVVTP